MPSFSYDNQTLPEPDEICLKKAKVKSDFDQCINIAKIAISNLSDTDLSGLRRGLIYSSIVYQILIVISIIPMHYLKKHKFYEYVGEEMKSRNL